jgi:hypothetical protein
MGWKHWAGMALLAWGGIGVINNVFAVQALSSGSAPTAALNSVDPATIFGVANPSGAAWTSPTMLTDAAIAGAGAWLLWG